MTYGINFLLIIHIFCVDFYVDTEHLIFYFVNIHDCRLQCRKRTTVTRNNQSILCSSYRSNSKGNWIITYDLRRIMIYIRRRVVPRQPNDREVLDIMFFAHFWPRSLYWILCHIWNNFMSIPVTVTFKFFDSMYSSVLPIVTVIRLSRNNSTTYIYHNTT